MDKLIFDKKGEFAINFSWDNEEPHWVNFQGAEVCSDYMDKNNPQFITFDNGSGVDSGCLEFKDVEKEDYFFTGFIKWDGCMEIHKLNHHFCHRSDILQRVADLIYDAGKEIMNVRNEFD